MIYDLKGKTVLVTGAGSGIGRAVAVRAARCDARVLVCDRNEEEGRQVVDNIRGTGQTAEFFSGDVADEGNVILMIEEAVRLWGKLDCAVNSAGIHGSQLGMQAKHLSEWSEEAFDSILAVNLRGLWLCMKYEIQQMKSQSGGSIINVASIGGLVGTRGSSAYVASKHGVLGLTRAAALEYAEDNVRINSVCPGVIETPLGNTALAGRTDGMLDALPAKRLGQPEEVASLCVHLLSDRAAFITGGEYLVDGAYLAG